MRIYFIKSDFRRVKELPLVAEVIVLLLNQSPGPFRLTQNWPVLRGRDAYIRPSEGVFRKGADQGVLLCTGLSQIRYLAKKANISNDHKISYIAYSRR